MGRGMAVETQIGARGLESDEYGGVDLRGEDGGLEYARQVEPLVAHPDALGRVDPVDAEPGGGRRAEHGDGFGRGRGVEVAALGDAGGDRLRQAEGGCPDGEPVGVDRGDLWVPVGGNAAADSSALSWSRSCVTSVIWCPLLCRKLHR